jgi:RNA polymerase subunit RPABC4/transcription elongation factor Spt4
MTFEAYGQAALDRQTRSATITAQPTNYAICCQCESIVLRAVPICPLCHGYRFNTSPEDIVTHVKFVCSEVFPRTAGTVPRFPKS